MTSSGTKAYPSPSKKFCIGGWTDRADYFTGRIKRVGLWDRLLTDGEVAELPGLRYPFYRANIDSGHRGLIGVTTAENQTDLPYDVISVNAGIHVAGPLSAGDVVAVTLDGDIDGGAP